MDHARSGDGKALAIVYLGLGPILGALATSFGLWTVMFLVAPPIALAIAYLVGGPCCIAALTAAWAGRRLDAPARLVLVATVGAAASYVASCFGMDETRGTMNVLMTMGGAAAAIACDRIAARPIPHMRILLSTAAIAAAWSALWGLYMVYLSSVMH
jgi:hypothetical protein